MQPSISLEIFRLGWATESMWPFDHFQLHFATPLLEQAPKIPTYSQTRLQTKTLKNNNIVQWPMLLFFKELMIAFSRTKQSPISTRYLRQLQYPTLHSGTYSYPQLFYGWYGLVSKVIRLHPLTLGVRGRAKGEPLSIVPTTGCSVGSVDGWHFRLILSQNKV